MAAATSKSAPAKEMPHAPSFLLHNGREKKKKSRHTLGIMVERARRECNLRVQIFKLERLLEQSRLMGREVGRQGRHHVIRELHIYVGRYYLPTYLGRTGDTLGYFCLLHQIQYHASYRLLPRYLR
jgi:hypothetical protein